MANTPLVGQIPVSINSTVTVTAVKMEVKMQRNITVRQGAYGPIGSAKGQPKYTWSIVFSLPKTGTEVDVVGLISSDDGFTLTYPEGANRFMLVGCQVGDDALSNDPEAGATDKSLSGSATDRYLL